MGLFGLFYTVFVVGAKGVKAIKSKNENEKRRIDSIVKGNETYIGDDGCQRLNSNNQKVMQTYVYKTTPYGEYRDYVLKQVGSNNIIKNYSEEKRNKEELQNYYNATLEGKTVYRLGTLRDNYYKSAINGYRYKDINTGTVYVIRTLNGVKFYMDIGTGEFIRETDGELIRSKNPNAHHHDKDEYEKLRQKFNEEQVRYFKEYGRINSRNTYCRGGKDWYEN